jgi:hypothetical protein
VTSAAVHPNVLPLVVVVYRVPLFFEAVAAAFEGLATVRGLRAEDGDVDGLVAALQPAAVIVERREAPTEPVADVVLHVDLERCNVRSRVAGEWTYLDVELSPEAIRNAVLTAITAGVSA